MALATWCMQVAFEAYLCLLCVLNSGISSMNSKKSGKQDNCLQDTFRTHEINDAVLCHHLHRFYVTAQSWHAKDAI